jgi:hypothetical protein
VAVARGLPRDPRTAAVAVAGTAAAAEVSLMARLPDAELDRLKREVAVRRLAEARGIALK